MTKTYRIACVRRRQVSAGSHPRGPGGAAGGAGLRNDLAFEFTSYGWGSDWYREHGEMMPAA